MWFLGDTTKSKILLRSGTMELTSQGIHIFIQGAGKGIGLAFVEELLSRNTQNYIHASYRSPQSGENLLQLQQQYPQQLHTYYLDVTDEKSVEDAATNLAQRTSQLQLLINSSGVLHGNDIQPEKKIEDINLESIYKGFAVNTFSILLMAKYFSKFFNHREHAVWANISAKVGSIADNRLGGWYTYRASKAAQNMITKTMSLEFKRIAKTTICIALHPGTVATNLSQPFVRNNTKRTIFSPEKCAMQLLEVIDGLTIDDTAKFFAWDGSTIPW